MTPSPAVLAARPAPRTGAPAAPTGRPVPSVRVLTLDEPVPGFPGHRDYLLVPGDTAGLMFWLQSVAVDGPRFLVVPTARFFPGYAPVLPGAARVELGLTDLDDADLYAILTVPPGEVDGATANLRAPVVVNRATGRARQIVLTDSSYPIRRPMRR